MKCLIALVTLLAATSAGVIAPTNIILQPQHLPIIGPNGVPLEPEENVAARIQHANAHLEAQIRNGDLAFDVAPVALPASAIATSLTSIPATLPVVSPYAAVQNLIVPQHLPVLGPNGVPIEPLANQLARAQSAAAHLEAKVRNGDVAILARKRRGLVSPAYLAVPQHLPVIGPNGVPLEPAENVAARIQHANAHFEAQVRNGDVTLATHEVSLPVASPVVAYSADPLATITHNGAIPLDTPEVAVAKAAHLATKTVPLVF